MVIGQIGPTNLINVIALPCDVFGCVHPSSIEFDPQEHVEQSTSIFTGQSQTYDLMNSLWTGTISFPPMNRVDADQWQAFILNLRGMMNCFLLGDPTAAIPKGAAAVNPGLPVVAGAGQTGYSLNTRGWTPGVNNLLLSGDYIQVGTMGTATAGYPPRLYRLTAPCSSSATGTATLNIWPNLRDLPPDGVSIISSSCVGIMRLAANQGNSYSSTPGGYGYGINGLKFRECI